MVEIAGPVGVVVPLEFHTLKLVLHDRLLPVTGRSPRRSEVRGRKKRRACVAGPGCRPRSSSWGS